MPAGRPFPLVDAPSASEALGDDLLEAVSLLRRAVRRVADRPAGLEGRSDAEVELVRFVRRNPGTSVNHAAEGLGLLPNSVSTLVRTLVDDGILERVQDPDDRRVARLSLTARTGADVATWRSRRSDLVTAGLERMPPADRRALEGALRPLVTLAATLAEDGGPR